MRKIVIGLLLLVGVVAPCRAWTMSEGDTSTVVASRLAQLSKAYAKSPNKVDVLYDLAQFYSDSTHAMFNLPMAMQYIKRAEECHIVLLERDKVGELTRLGRRDITITSIRQSKQAIVNAAYRRIETHTDMSGAELDAYQEAFGINDELVKKLRQNRIVQVYNDDLRSGTVDGYYHFITTYPGTSEAEQMEERIAQLAPELFELCQSEACIDSVAHRYPSSPSVQRMANKHRSKYAYAVACQQNTTEAYKKFLRAYPSSNEDALARERLDALLEVEYAHLSGARQYADFIDSNIDNSLSERALAELRRMVTEEHDAYAAELYLDRFDMDPAYNNILSTYYSWHSAEGNGAPIRAFIEKYPNFPYQRILDEDLEFAATADKVSLMEEFLEGEFPRYAAYVRQLYGKRISIVPLQRMIQGQLTSQNYKSALERIQQFDLCFDNVAHQEYIDLQRLLSTNHKGRKRVAELSGSYDIKNPTVNEADGRLYFTRQSGGTSRICYATRQGKKWVPDSEVVFDNASNSGMAIFNFFDHGNRMLLGKDNDIWIAERNGETWHVTEIPPYPVNTDYIEVDAYMLPDNSGMLLASDRPYGNNRQPSGAYFHGDTALATDLYFIPRTASGWGTPVNLGLNINTPYCERSPLLSKNLRTLYFISDGHGGLGYGDIYTATRSNTTDWAHWSTPQNIGKEINTGFSEASISFAKEEKEILFSSNLGNRPFACYSFGTWHSTESPTVDYNLKVQGMDGFLYRIAVADLDCQTVTQVVHCDGNCSQVNLNMQKGSRYAILGDAGQYFVPAIIAHPGSSKSPQLRGYTFPVLVAMDKPVTLEVVDFEDGSSRLRPVALLQLEQLATFVDRHSTCVVEIAVDVPGHDAAKAYQLSNERGKAIKDSMIAYGVAPDRIIISAYGNVHAKATGKPDVTVRFRDR